MSTAVAAVWTEEEDETLRRLIILNKIKVYAKLVDYFPGKTVKDIMNRWELVLRPTFNWEQKGKWSKIEDKKLVKLVETYGIRAWAMIACHLQGKLPKQCRERYHNQLDPNIRKNNFTIEEWKIVDAAHERYGNSWAKIAKFLPGRTANFIKNQWNTRLRQNSVSNSKKRKSPTQYDSSEDPGEEDQDGASYNQEDDRDDSLYRIGKEDADWLPATKRMKRIESSTVDSIPILVPESHAAQTNHFVQSCNSMFAALIEASCHMLANDDNCEQTREVPGQPCPAQ